MQLERNYPLTRHNTFGIAARALLFGRFNSTAQLAALLNMPEVAGMPRLFLGGGSNILFTQDFPGVVLLNEIPGITVVKEDDEHVFVKAGAGVGWHQFVLHCVENGWGGIENLSLIPGKVGAAPMQNIGAYGAEIKDNFVELEAFRLADGELVTFDREACQFGYRESFFKRAGKDKFVIVSVTFRLDKKHVLNTSYGTIAQELEQMGISEPTISDVSKAVIAIRTSKLPDPKVLGNAGSFFKNPVVAKEVGENIKSEFPDAAIYPAGDGLVKLAAGWLIEKAGLKGYDAGTHGVHAKQALVLVNKGNATGKEIFDLSTKVLQSVKEKFGVDLEREVNIL